MISCWLWLGAAWKKEKNTRAENHPAGCLCALRALRDKVFNPILELTTPFAYITLQLRISLANGIQNETVYISKGGFGTFSMDMELLWGRILDPPVILYFNIS